ncbi:hypothetical protein, partial [Methyloceanibacter marginalis]|uniref:hypothetical protein n=1 Tax=Methyloceanibacter marginalis TaxID=1774971 RepID=UPI00114D025F
MSLVVESRAALSPGRRPGVDAQRPAEAEYDFLLGRHVNAATLSHACVLADRWGVHPHQALVANGWLTEDDYYRAWLKRRDSLQGASHGAGRHTSRQGKSAVSDL